jgi:hypothetical protein
MWKPPTWRDEGGFQIRRWDIHRSDPSSPDGCPRADSTEPMIIETLMASMSKPPNRRLFVFFEACCGEGAAPTNRRLNASRGHRRSTVWIAPLELVHVAESPRHDLTCLWRW